MIKNYYYLIVGILCVLFAFTHAWGGHATVLPVFDREALDVNTKTVFHYVWHIITVENFILGCTLIVMALSKKLEKVRFTAWVIVSIMAMRWLTIFTFTFALNKSNLSHILVDTIAMALVITLIILGTRVENKVTDGQ